MASTPQTSMPSQRPVGTVTMGTCPAPTPPSPHSSPHTQGSHSDHKGQNDAQWEANGVVGDGVHQGSEGLPAGSSQNSAVDTLGGSRGAVSRGGAAVAGSRHLLGGLLNSHGWCSRPLSSAETETEPRSPGHARVAQRLGFGHSSGPAFASMPHRHLERAVKPETARQLARRLAQLIRRCEVLVS